VSWRQRLVSNEPQCQRQCVPFQPPRDAAPVRCGGRSTAAAGVPATVHRSRISTAHTHKRPHARCPSGRRGVLPAGRVQRALRRPRLRRRPRRRRSLLPQGHPRARRRVVQRSNSAVSRQRRQACAGAGARGRRPLLRQRCHTQRELAPPRVSVCAVCVVVLTGVAAGCTHVITYAYTHVWLEVCKRVRAHLHRPHPKR
jgi:hypothetical protein